MVANTLVACGGGGSEGTATTDLSGAWSGNASSSSGPGALSWTLQQSSASVSGTVQFATTLGTVTGRGTVTGQLDGNTLTFTISVPAGGFSAPFQRPAPPRCEVRSRRRAR